MRFVVSVVAPATGVEGSDLEWLEIVAAHQVALSAKGWAGFYELRHNERFTFVRTRSFSLALGSV